MQQRAALYLRVSTARQAEHDVSIPDQKRQGEAYCEARGLQLVETYVEPGASATNDRRPEFQRMIEAGTSKPALPGLRGGTQVLLMEDREARPFSPATSTPYHKRRYSPNRGSHFGRSFTVSFGVGLFGVRCVPSFL